MTIIFDRDLWERMLAERKAENAEIDAKFPVVPTDLPEKQREMEIARAVAKMDP